MNHIIIAPHPDDEIIGTYEILKMKKNIIIIYSANIDTFRIEESLKLKEYIEGVKVQLFQDNIPMVLMEKKNKFYYPDPVNEIHPKHRELGMTGEMYARSGFDVTFYSTVMNAPYIHEVEKPDEKEDLLNKVYPSQSSLWKYEKKYILFEGYCKWIF